MAFINYDTAFDSEETSAFMKAFRRQGIDRGNICEDIYKKSTATIKQHKISEKIPLQKGIR